MYSTTQNGSHPASSTTTSRSNAVTGVPDTNALTSENEERNSNTLGDEGEFETSNGPLTDSPSRINTAHSSNSPEVNSEARERDRLHSPLQSRPTTATFVEHPRNISTVSSTAAPSQSRSLPPGAAYAQQSQWSKQPHNATSSLSSSPAATPLSLARNSALPALPSSLQPGYRATARSASLPVSVSSNSTRDPSDRASPSSPPPAQPATFTEVFTSPPSSFTSSSIPPIPPFMSKVDSSRNDGPISTAPSTPSQTRASSSRNSSLEPRLPSTSTYPVTPATRSSIPISHPKSTVAGEEEVLDIRLDEASRGKQGALPTDVSARGIASEDDPPSMVGIGRTSLLRNSPLPLNQQFLGSGPSSSPTSPAAGLPFPSNTNDPPPRPVALPPPHLVPQPEICVECMMRDRDMADVDVTGSHVWDRESDAEFEEALRFDEEMAANASSTTGVATTTSGDHHYSNRGTGGGSEESGSLGAHGMSRRGGGGGSRESTGGRSSIYGHSGRKRLGRGQPLTTAGLKLWTSMNPPASAHRWRTLQTFLATQIHLLELERQKRESEHRIPNEQHEQLQHHLHASGASAAHRPASIISNGPKSTTPGVASTSSRSANRSSSPWRMAAGTVSGYLPTEQLDERQVRAQGQSRTSAYLESSTSPIAEHRNSTHSLQPPPAQPSGSTGAAVSSVRNYSYGDQPWLATSGRRMSTPGLRELGSMNGRVSPSQPRHSASTTPSPSTGFGTFVNKFARSSTDLRSIPSRPNSTRARDSSPPPPSAQPSSPSRAPSFALYPTDDRSSLNTNRRGSTWSRFRQSASQSVLSFAPSFAPSGSMMEMHLGMSADRHNAQQSLFPQSIGPGGSTHPYAMYDAGYPSMSDSMIARGRASTAGGRQEIEGVDPSLSESRTSEMRTGEKEKKKKGFKGFLSKLVGGSSEKKQIDSTYSSASAPATPRGILHPQNRSDYVVHPGPTEYGYYENNHAQYLPVDDELAPPPPLSALANEPRYSRSVSNSSVDSLGAPYTPPLAPIASNGMSWRNGAAGNGAHSADRRSINTLGSYTSGRSKVISGAGARSYFSNGNSMGSPMNAGYRRPSSDSLSLVRSPTDPSAVPFDHAQPSERAEVLSPQVAPEPIRSPRTQKSLPHISQPWEPTRTSSFSSAQYGPPPPIPASQPASPTEAYGNNIGQNEGFSRSARSLAASNKTASRQNVPLDDRRSITSRKSKVKSKIFSFGRKSSRGADLDTEGDDSKSSIVDYGRQSSGVVY